MLQPYFKSKEGISFTSLHRGILTRFAIEIFSYESFNTRKQKNTTDKLLTRTNLHCFLNQAPCSSFKKLIISTPSLLQGLHTMSLLMSVPEGLKPRECERTKLREPLPVPYVPTKDEVHKEVARLRNLEIKIVVMARRATARPRTEFQGPLILCWERPAPPWDCRGGLVDSSLFKQRSRRITTIKKYLLLFGNRTRASKNERHFLRGYNNEQSNKSKEKPAPFFCFLRHLNDECQLISGRSCSQLPW